MSFGADHLADAAPSPSAAASFQHTPVAGPSRLSADTDAAGSSTLAFGAVEPDRAAAALLAALMAVAVQLSPTARTRAADALDIDGSKLARRGSVRCCGPLLLIRRPCPADTATCLYFDDAS